MSAPRRPTCFTTWCMDSHDTRLLAGSQPEKDQRIGATHASTLQPHLRRISAGPAEPGIRSDAGADSCFNFATTPATHQCGTSRASHSE
eukprot:366553-Chlamydomonas_euryale.AAC.9